MLDKETLKDITLTSKNTDEMWDRIVYEKQKECLHCVYRFRCQSHGNYLCIKYLYREED